MSLMPASAPLLEPTFNTYPPLPENDPETWDEEFWNQSNLIFHPLPDEDYWKPMKLLILRHSQSRARQEKYFIYQLLLGLVNCAWHFQNHNKSIWNSQRRSGILSWEARTTAIWVQTKSSICISCESSVSFKLTYFPH